MIPTIQPFSLPSISPGNKSTSQPPPRKATPPLSLDAKSLTRGHDPKLDYREARTVPHPLLVHFINRPDWIMHALFFDERSSAADLECVILQAGRTDRQSDGLFRGRGQVEITRSYVSEDSALSQWALYSAGIFSRMLRGFFFSIYSRLPLSWALFKRSFRRCRYRDIIFVVLKNS